MAQRVTVPMVCIGRHPIDTDCEVWVQADWAPHVGAEAVDPFRRTSCGLSERDLFNGAGPSGAGWSTYEPFFRCRQLWAYKNLLGIKFPTTDPLLRGSLLHAGLAASYLRQIKRRTFWTQAGVQQPIALTQPEFDAQTRLVNATEALRVAALDPEWQEWSVDNLEECLPVMAAYESSHASEKLEVAGVEVLVVMSFPTRDGGRGWFSSRFDLVIRSKSGKYWVWDHKCLPARTEVMTSRGPIPVGELVGGPAWTCVTYDTNRPRWAPALAPVSAGVQPVYRIVTRGGSVEDYGHNHPVLTRRGWIAAAELRAGDEVATALGVPDVSEAPVADGFVYLTGALLADGALHGNFTYTKNSTAKRARFKAALAEVGAATSEWSERTPDRKAAYIRLNAGRVREQLLAYGLTRVCAGEKRIPKAFRGMSHRQTALLIGALWNGDGHIGVRDKGSVRIAYTSKSRALCADLRGLLLRLGIAATVVELRSTYRGKPYLAYNTTVVGYTSKAKFIDLVRTGEIPIDDVDIAAVNAAHARYANASPRGVRYDVTEGFMWDPVVANIYIGDEACYDVEVPDTHNFVAGGLVTHNSTRQLDGQKALSRYTLSGQFIGFQWFAQALFPENFAGMRINLLGVEPKTKQVNGAAVSYYEFDRVTPEPAPGALRGFVDNLRDMHEDVKRYLAEKRDPWRWPRAYSELVCRNAYGRCDAFDLCQSGEAGLIALTARDRRLTAHLTRGDH